MSITKERLQTWGREAVVHKRVIYAPASIIPSDERDAVTQLLLVQHDRELRDSYELAEGLITLSLRDWRGFLLILSEKQFWEEALLTLSDFDGLDDALDHLLEGRG